MNQKARERLEKSLGEKVSFDAQILAGYDHDIGEMPALVMSMVDNTPEAVVAAGTVDDVRNTLTAARESEVPVTPRGQASSGYGGAIPTRGGIVLDLTGMNRIISMDKDNLTVDVEPGAVWDELSRELNKVGMDNCIVPTSAPSSTVGGWFAMGGVGLGSLVYGSIRDVVQEIDVVALDGEVSTLSGEEMDLHYQTCGILGVVTRLRLTCRAAEEMRPFAVAFPDAAAVQAFSQAVCEELTPYAISIHSPGYVGMKKEMGEDEAVPGDSFLVISAIPVGSADEDALRRVAVAHGGEVLADEIARHSWNHRFYPMRIKKLGPSVLVGEFYLPLDSLSSVVDEIQTDLQRDLLGMEIFVLKGGQVAVLVYILDNAGSFLYQFRMAKALRPVRVAERGGGSLYTAGLWFASRSREILGSKKYDTVIRRKKVVDPNGLLNPGKIVPPRVRFLPLFDVSTMVDLSSRLASPLAKLIIYKRPHRERVES
jgi:FAD/FMN-containing dehydrogenase